MAEMLTQISALDDLIVQGRFGRSLAEGPGVALALVHPCEVVTIIAAKGKARALATALKTDFGLTLPGMGASASARGVSLHGTAPDQWLAVAPGASAGTLAVDADLVIDEAEIVVRCATCGAETPAAANRLVCGDCGDFHTRVISGDEMILQRVELETG